MGSLVCWASCGGAGLGGQQPDPTRRNLGVPSTAVLCHSCRGEQTAAGALRKNTAPAADSRLMVLLAMCYNHREVLCLWYHFP